MKRWIAFITLASATLGTLGCNTCCGPYDYDYPSFGGKHPRVDARYGRVGSIFSDPNAAKHGPSADSNLTPMTKQRFRSIDDEFNKELPEELKSTNPNETVPDIPDQGILPIPPKNDGTNPTASWLMKNPRLQSIQTWR